MNTQTHAVGAGGQAQRIDSPIDLRHLPVRRVESGYKVAGTILGLIGGIITLAAMGIPFGSFNLWFLVSPFSWVGIAIFLGGVHLAIMGKEITLDQDRVAMRRRGLFGRKHWVEPLAAYRGVRLRSKWESGGQRSGATQIFLVELVHTDLGKTVEIFMSCMDKGWHTTWRETSIRFRLTAIEETPDGETISTPEDLEQSVQEKALQGSLKIVFDPSEPPPAGLSLRVVDGGLDIRVLERNWRSPGLWGGVGAIVAGLGLLLVMISWQLPVTVLAVAGVLCALAAVGLFGGFMTSQARLLVGRDTVTASLVTPLGEMRKQVMATTRISGVLIGFPKGQRRGAVLHILTDDGRVFFGAGLSRSALEWLRNCLLAAVARL